MIWETTTINGQTAGIALPDDYYSAPGNRDIIIYHRGVGETVADLQFDPKGGVIAALHAAGYLIATVGTTPSNNFGNDDSFTQYGALLTWLLANTTNTGLAGVLSQSGGGPSGIRQYLYGSSAIKAWYGIYPMTNLAWATVAGFGPSGAYGGGSYAAGDPHQMPAADFAGKRFRATHSPDDLIVTKADNTDALRTQVLSQVAEFVVVVSSGDHGDASSFQPTDVVDYFDRIMVTDGPAPTLYLFRS
jgi:hypothetical protein